MDIVFYILAALCIISCVVLDKVEMQYLWRKKPVQDTGSKEQGDAPAILKYTTSVAIVLLAAGGQKDKVRQLLDAGMDVDKRDENGRTALIAAARRGHAQIVGMLLEEGCNVNATDTSGRTALIYAAREGFPPVVKLLLRGGADASIADRRGQTALDYAKAAKQDGIVEMLTL